MAIPPNIHARQNLPLSAAARQSLDELSVLFKKWRNRVDVGPINKANVLDDSFTEKESGIFKLNLLNVLREVDFTLAFSNSGIPQGVSFFDETIRILKGNILPYVYPPRDAEAVVREIFYGKKDGLLLAALFEALAEIDGFLSPIEKTEILNDLRTQARNAAEIVSYRIAALGMDEEIFIRAGRDEALVSPFMEQNREINTLLRHMGKGYTEKLEEDLAHARLMIKHCGESLTLIDKAAEQNGTSLKQTFLLRKLELLQHRLLLLLSVSCAGDADEAFGSLATLLKDVILAETNPRSLRDFISRNISLIAYRITENKRKTGEHYVASSRQEYWDLFISACGGGFIVSLMVMIKLATHEMKLPLLWECMAFGALYASGFVVIQLLNFTLATKQPAMTAAYIAASMDDIRDDASRYHHLASTIASVFRGQMVSFAGNLLVVFPCTLCWVFFYGLIMHHSFASEEQGPELINGVSAFTLAAVWYAAITGVQLFLAGIVSGFGDNKVVVSRIGERLEAHPWLRKYMPEGMRFHFAAYIERSLGPLLGNIAFGFMLAFTIFLGKITGLPFDIRHITFSTGNVAVGIMSVHFHITWMMAMETLLGLFFIGFLNFAVSFGLALQVAARSRDLRLKDYPDMILAVMDHFWKHPSLFFYPPRIETPLPEAAPV